MPIRKGQSVHFFERHIECYLVPKYIGIGHLAMIIVILQGLGIGYLVIGSDSDTMIKVKRFIKILFWLVLGILLVWWLLTLYVQQKGPYYSQFFGNKESTIALIAFDGDPFYNLDERVCTAFAKGLSANGIGAQVVSVRALNDVLPGEYDMMVFCANTYNWAPDRAMVEAIKDQIDIDGQKVVAITIGSGSTKRAQKLFEQTIIEEGGHLLATETYWLLRPNDESQLEQSNVVVAEKMAIEAANKIAGNF
ncbi:hypothetical protein [Flagellimonas lutaonensis]|nr:hypothetical protein [Allomuricauda lutaonensis]